MKTTHQTRRFADIARKAGAIAALIGLAACADGNFVPESKLGGCAETNSCASNPTLSINANRPAQVYIPSDYNNQQRYPLVVLLHGFGANGLLQTIYLGLDSRVDSGQYILVAPDGTPNETGTRFWNATPACCAFSEEDRMVDDVAYVRSLITEAAATYSIDETRVGLIGHSNGGFMSLRMACEASDIITSVVSLAGSTFADAPSCAPATNPVSVLAMHGTLDGTISYDGRPGDLGFPSAPETAARFAATAGCDVNNPVSAPAFDLLDSIDGDESTVLNYTGCQQGADVSLWTLVGAPHIPTFWNTQGFDRVIDWLTTHPRP